MHLLKAEFHCHVKLFSHSIFRPVQLRRRLNWAKHIGLDVLAVTEHIDVPDFWKIYRCLENFCGNGSGGNQWRGVTVLTGAEVSIDEGGDILLIGSIEALKKLENRLGRLSAENFPFFKSLLDASEDLGFLRIGAHPCRPNKELWKMGALLKRLDALEINAGELSMSRWVLRQSRELNVPVLAGSDAHHWLQMGQVCNLLPLSGSFTTAELKQAIAEKKVVWHRENALSVIIRGLSKGVVQ